MAPGVGGVEEDMERGRNRLALQASSWAKSTMGTSRTHFRKLAL